MNFVLRQLFKTYKSLPFYYRLPHVGWKVVPVAATLTSRYLSGAARFAWASREPLAARHTGDERLTVILPSYDRIANIEPIVKTYLRLPFVERVVVTNNNPRYRIAEWVRLDDPRLVLLDQPVRTGPGVRFEVARAYPSRFYFTVDDDLFLTPNQIEALFLELVAEPERLHGLCGQLFVGTDEAHEKLGGWDNNWMHQETEVDVLNRIYAFTGEHLGQYFERLPVVGAASSREIGNGEDVLLSSTGAGRPRVHDVGPWFDCISDWDPGVALHLALPTFAEDRAEMFLKLRRHLADGAA